MKHLLLTILFLSGLIQANAFDAALPETKTIAWSLKKADVSIPSLDLTNTTIREIIKFMDRSDGSPGFFIDVDVSAVTNKLDKKVTIKAKDLPWLELLGQVADLLDSDILVQEGVFKLVPRNKNAADTK